MREDKTETQKGKHQMLQLRIWHLRHMIESSDVQRSWEAPVL